MRLQGKVAFITGAGSGLGRESARLFSKEGASVIACDVNRARVEDVAEAIVADGGRAFAIEADVSQEEQVAAAIDMAVTTYGHLDILFANAGIMVPGLGTVALSDLSLDAWNRTLAVNLTGVFLCCKYAVPAMKENSGGGAILFTSSMAALRAYPNTHAYAASKGGLNALVTSLSVDLGQFGIRVNAICPSGGMSTNFLKDEDAPVTGTSYDEVREWDPNRAPYPLKLSHPPSIADNAAAALFLVSDEASWITGVCLPTSDGALMHTVGSQLRNGWQKKMIEEVRS
jgi:NAD(P)-dependent dehydrogenase (short-subunit alcohol dehydrogenase family)